MTTTEITLLPGFGVDRWNTSPARHAAQDRQLARLEKLTPRCACGASTFPCRPGRDYCVMTGDPEPVWFDDVAAAVSGY